MRGEVRGVKRGVLAHCAAELGRHRRHEAIVFKQVEEK